MKSENFCNYCLNPMEEGDAIFQFHNLFYHENCFKLRKNKIKKEEKVIFIRRPFSQNLFNKKAKKYLKVK